ncbi:hypothetical protein ACTHGU_11890 [Chitinophagaceae bacterium MMS25-I14]
MRDLKTFTKDIISKPPMLFPWVVLFHIAALVISLWINHTEPFGTIAWLQPLWMLCYATAWIFICDLKKWAAYLYLLFSMTDLVLYILKLKTHGDYDLYLSALFPANVLFCFFVLFYFKRFK